MISFPHPTALSLRLPCANVEHDAGGVCGVLRDVHQAWTGYPQHDIFGVQVRV